MRNSQKAFRVVRWRGGQHPTLELLKHNLENHGLRAFKWTQHANYRYGVRSHGFAKSLYCVSGSVEVILPDHRERVKLRIGDRIDIARGVRHSVTVGNNGATCLEGTPARRSVSTAR
jgi:hypothetical protein